MSEQPTERIWVNIESYDVLRAELARLKAELAALRTEIKEWLCESCNTVFPGPPTQGFDCVVCPNCHGNCGPRSSIEKRKLEDELADMTDDRNAYKAAYNGNLEGIRKLEAELERERKTVSYLRVRQEQYEATINSLDQTRAERDAALAEAGQAYDTLAITSDALEAANKRADAAVAALANAQIALWDLAIFHGPCHEKECPEDETCSCHWKPLNDAVHAVFKDTGPPTGTRYHALAAAIRKRGEATK